MTDSATDIPANDWIDRQAPPRLRPYLRLARLDRPIGTWLLLLPCWWGVAIASTGWPDLRLLTLFAAGAIVMRGAGCTFNDIVDRDIDARVARTATRPLPSGAISVQQAAAFFLLQCIIGLAILVQFNALSIWVGVASLGLVAIYPFMKRITHWPQAVLGLAFNWGVLVGWSAVTGGLALPPLLLYAAGVAWTLAYDTIYAHQDKGDDVRVGVKSTAILLGAASKRWLAVFFALALILIAGAGAMAGAHLPVLLAGLAVAGAHALWQVMSVDLYDPRDCLAKFRSNRDLGLIVLAAIIAGRVTG